MAGGKRKSRRGKRKSRTQVEETPVQKKEEAKLSINPKSRTRFKESASSGASNSAKKPSFLEKMHGRLSGGYFRMLNEKLYTCSGDEAFELFKKDPKLFNVYHTGYQEQMSNWPEKPVNIIIKWLKNHSSSLVVADFGCGDAILAKNVKNKVFSMDLVSNDPSVIACDMSHKFVVKKSPSDESSLYLFVQTPLDSSSVDVAVFCLSLMGTNFPNYLQEANRVLKPSGWLLIAEVRSRLDPNNGGADPKKFSEAIKNLGFTFVSEDFTNKMFVLMYFKKEGVSEAKNIEWPELKPCLYKRR